MSVRATVTATKTRATMNKSTAPSFASPIYAQFKNKLHETKAWASSHNAKQIQAQLICLTESLLLLLRYSLEIHENIRNEAEIKRRQQRLTKAVTEVIKNGGKVPLTLLMLQHLTQTSVKFIGWVAALLYYHLPWERSITHLPTYYTSL